jgi:hypothetical protein
MFIRQKIVKMLKNSLPNVTCGGGNLEQEVWGLFSDYNA